MTIPCPATSASFDASSRSDWMSLSPTQRLHVLAKLNSDELDAIASDWKLFAHQHQWPPDFTSSGRLWTTWLMIGGRGAGKTRAGAEWIRAQALGLSPLAGEPAGRSARGGETEHDVREVMIEGVSGLLAVHRRDERPVWLPSRKRLEWNNGAAAYAFSAEDPESLRGPQFSCAWSDELAKWRYADAAFDMPQFGLRLGMQPRQLITTTPRPTALIKRLLTDETCVTTRAPTRANALHLAPTFLRIVMGRYAGTRLGRQELDGELIEDRTDALWTRSVIEQGRVTGAPPLQRIVVAVDPPATSGKRADSCGFVAAGVTGEGMHYVLVDDALVVEVNQGGEMVRAVIAQADHDVPVIPVRAHRGKWLRAEPIATLYEQGRVKHVGVFAALEDEMCDFAPTGLSSGRSPDRLDALVWALTSLTHGARGQPRVREL